MLSFLLTFGLLFHSIGWANDLDFGFIPALQGKDKPTLYVTSAAAIKQIKVTAVVGKKTYNFTKRNQPSGKEIEFSWPRNKRVTEALVTIHAVFKDGRVEEAEVPMKYTYGGGFDVDMRTAKADVKKKQLSISVNKKVDRAEIIAYGAKKAILDQRTVEVNAGPGKISLPWTGRVSEVVLLDITLHSGEAFSGFTYSPWFLDIPRKDVAFATNSSTIDKGEYWKLEATLRDLNEVIEKYGSVVDVKLFIAGCTDRVGDSSKNKRLSEARARSIASWLRSNGYKSPIFYYGFGESLLAVQTADGVDEGANRRALYLVGANPPPAGSGVPRVNWKKLD